MTTGWDSAALTHLEAAAAGWRDISPMRVTQAMLRHSRMGTTSDLYSHVTDPMTRSAAVSMDGVLTRLAKG